ncbi:MAG: hypothetical protein IPK93_01150 [Solirubrobacterales bacterium]|nr:hypothetical protein [Solirubrobacterales bacterium]
MIPGEDLATRISREGALDPAQVDILGQVASALDAVHDKGIIPRDVKPANVLLDDRVGIDHLATPRRWPFVRSETDVVGSYYWSSSISVKPATVLYGSWCACSIWQDRRKLDQATPVLTAPAAAAPAASSVSGLITSRVGERNQFSRLKITAKTIRYPSRTPSAWSVPLPSKYTVFRSSM